MIESGNREQSPQHTQAVIVTCITDNRAHAVLDSQLATAVETGRYNALCGHLVSAAPMTEPDGEPCLLCEELRDRPAAPRRRHRTLRRLRG
jgi:hypothetical protein